MNILKASCVRFTRSGYPSDDCGLHEFSAWLLMICFQKQSRIGIQNLAAYAANFILLYIRAIAIKSPEHKDTAGTVASASYYKNIFCYVESLNSALRLLSRSSIGITHAFFWLSMTVTTVSSLAMYACTGLCKAIRICDLICQHADLLLR